LTDRFLLFRNKLIRKAKVNIHELPVTNVMRPRRE